MASTDYSRIKKEYMAGGTSYRKLAEKYGVPFGTLRKVAAKEQWTQLRTQTRAKADTKIAEVISDKEADKAEKIIDVADRLLSKITEVLEVVTTTQDIRHLTSALKDIKDIKGVKSEADIREQEARIRNLEKQAMGDSPTERDVNVTFDGDISKYSK